MQPLEKSLRNQLERTVKQARDIAEAAARAALGQLGVGEAAAFEHLSDEDKAQRRRLRVHGRQLGDSLNGGKVQTMDRLVEEVAYEHWHRMLFARFLAENDLLMYDGVSITLEECEELAAEEGAANGWELAARLAAKMLPQIFRHDSPVFQLHFAANHQLPLEKLLSELPREVFTASDSLGWVYQFWQAKKKDEVNASEVKIGARELAAVTQLFTEPYMVSFLLDNSLGAWWAARRLTETDLRNASSEEELRRKAAIPGVPLEYLRFVQQEGGTWTPAAGTFDGWPEQLADLKTLDPCCGSGHFLVAAFLMLVPMRMERDGLSAKEAVDAVLRENIHGLELDQRCVELAAFALALTAWKYPSVGGYRMLPDLNVACSGLSISAKKEEWLALAGDNTNLRIALEELYKEFKDAPVLGSLINPEASLGKGSLFELKWEEVGPLLSKALAREAGDDKNEMAVVAKGLSQAALILDKKYSLVATNVPYLVKLKHGPVLKAFCESHYPASQNDLATVFLERVLSLSHLGGNCSLVLPQNWLFQKSYVKTREKLLENDSIKILAKLGAGAFETISGEVVKGILFSINFGKQGNGTPSSSNRFASIDASGVKGVKNKASFLTSSEIQCIEQAAQLKNTDSRILTIGSEETKPLSDFATALHGQAAGDNSVFNRFFWEVDCFRDIWELYQCPPDATTPFGGRDSIVFWENENGMMADLAYSVRHLNHKAQQWRSGKPNWGKQGIGVNLVGKINATLYTGEIYAQSCCVIVPEQPELLMPLWCYAQSGELEQNLRDIDPGVAVSVKTVLAVPFDIDRWKAEAAIKGDELPNPDKQLSDSPTQWVFHGHPLNCPEPLQVAVARLLGYRWPAELDTSMELADEQREWVKRCEALASYADDDGIVCIPPVRGEASASDRLLNLLAAAYGDAWSNDTLAGLLKDADHAGKTLETWLREKFFTQHCKLFQHRPFIWHIWDGLRDGFAALVNYHKLDYKALETLIYTYLGDWISRQKQDIANGVDGAQERLAAAERLKKKLELILEGEAPYDIFVRWKPLEKQPIGWDPDLNDGVRLNIRPFLTVPDVGKKGAGVLRDKPNINWNKDRGKDVESAPWYHVFDCDRINDHHLTLAEKAASRDEFLNHKANHGQ